MPDYQEGKIYKIVSGDLVYIGSTTQSLKARMTGHKTLYDSWKRGKSLFITAFPLIETGQYEISLIESYPCQSRIELSARERFWIETTNCVNKVIPGRTINEYRIDNAEKIKEQVKAYHLDNADTIKEYNKEWKKKNCEKQKEYNRLYYERNRKTLL